MPSIGNFLEKTPLAHLRKCPLSFVTLPLFMPEMDEMESFSPPFNQPEAALCRIYSRTLARTCARRHLYWYHRRLALVVKKAVFGLEEKMAQ